ncbi:hypothetical protein CSKR_107334 [Clonorchis sinensis]|uniref:Uncharacterized protein n=1 Tax=Clonorchis sinensis TaxID=79923 RepID=A0A419QBC6_CLOSI|nr:hypothetical protein CSKR_107334 [Clonorchis sinensis]
MTGLSGNSVEFSEPLEPVKPVVTWTDMKLKVDWAGKLNLLEQIQQVHLVYNEDGIPKKRIAKQADGHLFTDVLTGHLDCNMLFAVENHAGISPFTTVPVPARNRSPDRCRGDHVVPIIWKVKKLPKENACDAHIYFARVLLFVSDPHTRLKQLTSTAKDALVPTSVTGRLINLSFVVPKYPALPVPQNLQIKFFKNILAHLVVWSPVSPDCDITYVLQTEVMNSGGQITTFNTETKQTEITFKDIRSLTFYRYSVKTRNENGEASNFSLPGLAEAVGRRIYVRVNYSTRFFSRKSEIAPETNSITFYVNVRSGKSQFVRLSKCANCAFGCCLRNVFVYLPMADEYTSDNMSEALVCRRYGTSSTLFLSGPMSLRQNLHTECSFGPPMNRWHHYSVTDRAPVISDNKAIKDKLNFEVSRINGTMTTINWAGALHRLSHAEELVLVITGGEILRVINEKVQTMQHYVELPDVQEDISFYAAAQNPSGLSAFQKHRSINKTCSPNGRSGNSWLFCTSTLYKRYRVNPRALKVNLPHPASFPSEEFEVYLAEYEAVGSCNLGNTFCLDCLMKGSEQPTFKPMYCAKGPKAQCIRMYQRIFPEMLVSCRRLNQSGKLSVKAVDGRPEHDVEHQLNAVCLHIVHLTVLGRMLDQFVVALTITTLTNPFLQSCNNSFALTGETSLTEVSSPATEPQLSRHTHPHETITDCLKCGPSKMLTDRGNGV